MNSSTHICFLRHGETQGGSRFNGSTDVALSEYGRSQMWAAMENESNLDRIISSPLIRCANFSLELKQQYGIPLKFDNRIKEIHFGAWEGKSAEEIMANDADALTRYWQDPTQYTPPDGEALKNFETRLLSFWQEIIKAYHGESILLVAHGGVIRLLLCHILQRPLQRMLEIEVAHATIYRIRVERSQHICTAFIETEI
ncbi:MAG: alpha-ribazole phosphatase family protein [Gammaproteobacteria bacterium]|nr:alpha-ribazole phosphatase family protein [Gammaproteobacteria bacterium]